MLILRRFLPFPFSFERLKCCWCFCVAAPSGPTGCPRHCTWWAASWHTPCLCQSTGVNSGVLRAHEFFWKV